VIGRRDPIYNSWQPCLTEELAITEADCDALRTPETVLQPDFRSRKTDILTGEPLTIAYEYDAIAKVTLDDRVPRNIRAQFDTSRNLYLYAWFVYRFYPIAEKQAYACLELALRERYAEELAAVSKRKLAETTQGLKPLLTYAVEKGHLKNENFSLWRNQAEMRARQRTEMEIWEKARQEGLDEFVYDPEEFEIKDVDRDHDYLQAIISAIPALRNAYAHGSNTLHDKVLYSMVLVSEIINQIYAAR